jgi:hypothetical protein
VCLVGESDVLFIDVDTPTEKTARRTFRASRPSKALTRMRSWSECQWSLLSIVGTACRFHGMTNVTVAASTCGQWLNAHLGRPLY